MPPSYLANDICQIWMWSNGSNMCFCKIENPLTEKLTNGLSNPHPAPILWNYHHLNFHHSNYACLASSLFPIFLIIFYAFNVIWAVNQQLWVILCIRNFKIWCSLVQSVLWLSSEINLRYFYNLFCTLITSFILRINRGFRIVYLIFTPCLAKRILHSAEEDNFSPFDSISLPS